MVKSLRQIIESAKPTSGTREHFIHHFMKRHEEFDKSFDASSDSSAENHYAKADRHGKTLANHFPKNHPGISETLNGYDDDDYDGSTYDSRKKYAERMYDTHLAKKD